MSHPSGEQQLRAAFGARLDSEAYTSLLATSQSQTALEYTLDYKGVLLTGFRLLREADLDLPADAPWLRTTTLASL